MIGQENLINKIRRWHKTPRIIIIVGLEGGGKKTLAKKIAEMKNLSLTTDTEKAKMILLADFKKTDTELVLNPPYKTGFILTTTDLQNIPKEIRAKSKIIALESYTKSDFKRYAKLKGYDISDEIIKISETLADIDTLSKINIDELYKTALSIKSNIKNLKDISIPKNSKYILRIIENEYFKEMQQTTKRQARRNFENTLKATDFEKWKERMRE